MSTRPVLRFLTFISASAIVGLAAAFIAVVVRPELIGRRAPSREPAPAAVPTPAPASASVPAPAQTSQPETAPRPPNSYAEAVERAAPAVVNIYTARLVTERIQPNAIEELFGDARPRYRQRLEQSLGSGVIMDTAAHVITNHHVIASADLIRAQLADGRIADAKIVGRDPDTDLAVLQLDLKTSVPVMPLGHSDRMRVGDIVLAIGNPVGLSQTVTQGIISATGRGQLGVATFENFIQTDAPINVGNSGGALINAEGELIGINTAVLAKNLGVEGIGFAIPVNLVRGVMSEILTKGRVVRGWIGIVPADIDEQRCAALQAASARCRGRQALRGQPGRDRRHGAARHDPDRERREGGQCAGRAHANRQCQARQEGEDHGIARRRELRDRCGGRRAPAKQLA